MSTEYIEARARFMNDPVFANWIVKILREEMQTGGGVRRDEPCIGADGVPIGYITYQQAADLVGYKVRSVGNAVHQGYMHSICVGRFHYLGRTEWLTHVMRTGTRSARERALAVLGETPIATEQKMAVNS